MNETAYETQKRGRLNLLLFAHVFATFAIVVFEPVPGNIVAFVVTASQFSLLAIWLAFGNDPTRVRCAIAGVSAFFLVVARAAVELGPISYTMWGDYYFFLEQTSFNRLGRFVIVSAILIVVRRKWIRIAMADSGHALQPSHLQFRLRHLMLLTLLAAFAIMIGQRIHTFFGESSRSIFNDPYMFAINNVVFLLVGLVYSLTIVSLSLWAALGHQRPLIPAAAAIVVAAMMSPLWPLLSRQTADGFATQTMVTICQTMLVLASLLVVRTCGYRLMKVDATDQSTESN